MSKTESNTIEGLHVFLNPVIKGLLYIETKHNQSKTIEIFDVLGNRLKAASLLGKKLNVSRLPSGIYIPKTKENNISAVIKLIIK